jgi:hypothetical protein
MTTDLHVQPSAADLRSDRIRARRRIAMRVGLLVIAMTSATACIFDRSTYQGGGRTDHGATAATQSATDTVPMPTDTTTPTDDGGLDANLGID